VVASGGIVGGSGTPEDGVKGIAGLGGGDVGVNGRGGEGCSEATSVTSGIFGGREDDLLGGESRKGGRGDWGEPLRGRGHSCKLAPSCLSSSSLQRRFLVLLAGGEATSGEGIVNSGGVEDVVGSGDVVGTAEGWVSYTGEGAGGCMSSEGEAAGPRHRLRRRRRRRRRLRSVLVLVDGAGRRHEMMNS
jgi:hypothetical protein